MIHDHNQHPLGTGFTASSTADEVLQGIDLTGMNVVVTGGHSGIGLETTRALSKAGACVTVAARRPQRALAAVADMAHTEVSPLDLMDPASIDAFTGRWLDSGRPLQILINNAGLPAPRDVMRDARGYEAQFVTNYLGHFQLTQGLRPALHAAHGARVVNVTSGAQRFGNIRWHDPHFITGYDPLVAYAQSKTAAVLFAVELDRRWAAEGIRGYAAHPGVVVGTGLNSAAGEQQLRASGLIDEAGRPIINPATGRKTPPQGAATIVFAATSPLLGEVGGVYLKDCDISPLIAEDLPMTSDPDVDIPADVAPHSIDPRAARRLWQLSEQLLAR
ncbi:SDR family NAD(P)-dependent oxidoreductase [Mycobacterium sp. 1245805.9]|uniref:SDR family NAD(P)-dependent oxidoreductase n=1 Tax=Mycobacterium sp. 1245805.9 TaxID=1856862 RepID=UPI0007FE3376|nr:SDR family NAD(P)-dependent oxidoreductase [Mycobacterium sp. 1245805.9]OBI94168.1 oxidoreductase [Mycobacterium sp. 1245805.9]